MTPENMEKWFNISQFSSKEYLEVHVHSIITRNKQWEVGIDILDALSPNVVRPPAPRVTFEVGITLRDPLDRLLGCQNTHLVLSEDELMQFKNDLLPLSEMAKILYQKEDKNEDSE